FLLALCVLLLFLLRWRPPRFTLFPYTTLFRSYRGREGTGREYAESGQITQEVEWVEGRERRIRQWYLDGQLKLDQTVRRLGRDDLRETRSFEVEGPPADGKRERRGPQCCCL